MAWTAPRTWVAGETVTAALMNTHIRDDLSYLKGSSTDVITIAIEKMMSFSNDANYTKGISSGSTTVCTENYDSNDYSQYSRSDNRWAWVIGNVEIARIESNGLIRSSSALLPVAPFQNSAGACHIEGGSMNASSGSQDFANQFSDVPYVTAFSNSANGVYWSSITATGFTWTVPGGGGGTYVSWIAIGPD